MFLRKSFQEFLVLHSEPEPLPTSQPRPQPSSRAEDRESAPSRQRVIDWRWFEARENAP
jgi:hypothetical protein